MPTRRQSKVRIAGFLGIVCGALCGVGTGILLVPSRPPDGPGSAPSYPAPHAPVESAGWSQALGSQPRFVDVADAAGVSFHHYNGLTGKYHYPEVMGAGVALFDADGDGFLDIYLVQGNHLLQPPSPEYRNRLFHNNGDGTFSDITERAGVGDPGFGQGACVADYDGDGDLDLYVSNYGPNVLYRNRGDGTFEDATSSAGVGDPGWGQSSSFLDADGDGWLDLYVQNYLEYSLDIVFEAFIYMGERKVLDYPSPRHFPGAPDLLYRNLGDGTFADVSETAGIAGHLGKGMGSACFDYDDDGHVDLFVSNDSMENYLFRNKGNGTFEDVALLAGVAYDGAGLAEASMGVDVADVDGDGRMDFAVPCVWGQIFSLYRNEGDHFTDISLRAGLAAPTAPATGFCPAFLDYDNDGDVDLFFSTGGVRMEEIATADTPFDVRYGIRDILLANDGTGRFVDVSRLAGPHFEKRLVGRGAAVGDIDNDGDLDIVLSNLMGKTAILRNDTQGGHWLTLRLIGSGGNRDALGASVWCAAGGKVQRAIVHGGVSYLSQNDRRIHFGLGSAARVDRLEIRWPNGERQVIEGLPVDRIRTIRQGEPFTE